MEFRSQADRDYANGAFIEGAAHFPPRWQREAATFRDHLGARFVSGRTYGPGERQKLDLFFPEDKPKGLLVFIHGGYWMAFDRADWSHLAAGALARGWACAMPSYTLAPANSISGMTQEIRSAIMVAASDFNGPVVVSGHSAGGHLAARMGCDDGPDGVDRVVPISPLADLRPLRATEMNEKLNLTEAEAFSESPALRMKRPGVGCHVWVGGKERPAFLWQARVLSEDWNSPWTVEAGKHHFDIVDGLADPSSPLLRACLDGF